MAIPVLRRAVPHNAGTGQQALAAAELQPFHQGTPNLEDEMNPKIGGHIPYSTIFPSKVYEPQTVLGLISSPRKVVPLKVPRNILLI